MKRRIRQARCRLGVFDMQGRLSQILMLPGFQSFDVPLAARARVEMPLNELLQRFIEAVSEEVGGQFFNFGAIDPDFVGRRVLRRAGDPPTAGRRQQEDGGDGCQSNRDTAAFGTPYVVENACQFPSPAGRPFLACLLRHCHRTFDSSRQPEFQPSCDCAAPVEIRL